MTSFDCKYACTCNCRLHPFPLWACIVFDINLGNWPYSTPLQTWFFHIHKSSRLFHHNACINQCDISCCTNFSCRAITSSRSDCIPVLVQCISFSVCQEALQSFCVHLGSRWPDLGPFGMEDTFLNDISSRICAYRNSKANYKLDHMRKVDHRKIVTLLPFHNCMTFLRAAYMVSMVLDDTSTHTSAYHSLASCHILTHNCTQSVKLAGMVWAFTVSHNST